MCFIRFVGPKLHRLEYGSLIHLLLYVSFVSTLVVRHLHPNIHQYSWKLLEINPTTTLDVLLLWFYAGIDGVNFVFNSRQHGPDRPRGRLDGTATTAGLGHGTRPARPVLAMRWRHTITGGVRGDGDRRTG